MKFGAGGAVLALGKLKFFHRDVISGRPAEGELGLYKLGGAVARVFTNSYTNSTAHFYRHVPKTFI